MGYVGGLLAQSDKQTLIKTSLFTAKKDTTPATPVPVQKKDTLIKAKKHDPRIATRRSAILPGWGQAYNREYWKIPIVYGILAIPAGLYVYNDGYYKKTKFAYEALFKAQVPTRDSSDIPFIAPEVKGLSLASLQSYRNSFRRDRDYAVLWFLIAWGLQVADATVFGHLKQFDVSNDLSMEITPAFNPGTKTPALSLTLNLKNPSHRTAIAR
ncbi:MAG: hypothetical protein NVSMB63_17920 [Sediminibacterium sp.]